MDRNERRLNRIQQAKIEASNKYIDGYIQYLKGLVKNCSGGHNETIRSVNVFLNEKGLVIFWKCQTCGLFVRTFESNQEVVKIF